MRTAGYDFVVSRELIAQVPAPERDQSRLLVLDRATGGMGHRLFRELPVCLQQGDVLVLNNSRVIPARLRGVNLRDGGGFELLLLEEKARNEWCALVRPARRARVGTWIVLRDAAGQVTQIGAEVVARSDGAQRRLHFAGTADIGAELATLGEVPLPPYIKRPGRGSQADDPQRYQTVFAAVAGSVAAPTAGLHFTEPLLEAIRARGVGVCFLTLHVGLGTFAPVRVEHVAAHVMHEERFEVSAETAATINEAKQRGQRVVAVGTSVVRVLESLAAENAGRLVPQRNRTRLFIYPPYNFRVVDALVTNFHLPRSTLLLLVCAFAAPGQRRGRGVILHAYAEAVRRRYRFYSYGDAMLIR